MEKIVTDFLPYLLAGRQKQNLVRVSELAGKTSEGPVIPFRVMKHEFICMTLKRNNSSVSGRTHLHSG
jgi:hypothetical protein